MTPRPRAPRPRGIASATSCIASEKPGVEKYSGCSDVVGGAANTPKTAGKPLITAGASRRNERVRLIDLGPVVNAELLQDRPDNLTEPVARFF
ncbi:MAG: hypothetical protein JWR37_2202 [Mycobacterium sp.]|nr:hypothetical protein [Mycobacterium sp.]